MNKHNDFVLNLTLTSQTKPENNWDPVERSSSLLLTSAYHTYNPQSAILVRMVSPSRLLRSSESRLQYYSYNGSLRPELKVHFEGTSTSVGTV